MRKRDVSVKTSGEVVTPSVGLELEVDATVVRGRPGRRTVAEKRDAVMRLLSGRATADQLARQYGVLPETVLGWRDAALAGIESALASGDNRSERERALELEVRTLKETLGQATVDRALAIRAVEEWKQQSRPSRPTRSRR